MKKTVCALFLATFFMAGCTMFTNPKQYACQQACHVNYDSCVEQANEEAKKGKDTSVMITACVAKRMACLEACDKL